MCADLNKLSNISRRTLGIGLSPSKILQGIWAQGHEFQWLPNWGYQQESILACKPIDTLQQGARFQWESLRSYLHRHQIFAMQNAACGPLAGGVFGAVSYEAALHMERVRNVRERSLGHGDAHFAYYPVVIGYDWQSQEWFLSGAIDSFPDYANELAGIWEKASEDHQQPAPHESAHMQTLVPEAHYANWVKQARERILNGDIYQANLAHPLQVSGSEPLPQLFSRIHAANPSPWACLFRTSSFTLVSNSPELLVSCRNHLVRAKPIAGTRPRGEDDEADARHRQNLIRSPKERAEHLMLVDLVRNDLGRVCEAGSVHVPLLMDREPYRNVTHIVSTVEGRLDSTQDSLSALAAAFPGGTITGTPKLRSMEIIDELEDYARGFYTGSLGYFAHGGDMEFNILIRSLQLQENGKGWQGHLHVGAGIVADSNPQREYQETLHKAAAWKEILSCK